MPRHPRLAAALVVLTPLLMIAPCAAEADPQAQPTLTFDLQRVAVAGVPAGSEVVLWAVSREPQGYFTRVVRHEEVLVTDAAGEAHVELDREVPVRSVWVAAELGTGALTLATPGEFPLRHSDLEPADLARGSSGQRDTLLRSIERLELLLLRPGVGAWRMSLHDGGDADVDGADDGKLAAALRDLEPIGAAPPAPEGVLPGDRLVAIDPATLELFTLTVPQ